jgi:hypothetical protein
MAEYTVLHDFPELHPDVDTNQSQHQHGSTGFEVHTAAIKLLGITIHQTTTRRVATSNTDNTVEDTTLKIGLHEASSLQAKLLETGIVPTVTITTRLSSNNLPYHASTSPRGSNGAHFYIGEDYECHPALHCADTDHPAILTQQSWYN